MATAVELSQQTAPDRRVRRSPGFPRARFEPLVVYAPSDASKTLRAALLGCVVFCAWLSGCAKDANRIETPAVLVSPYDPAHGEALWAVVPLRNESGVSGVDTYMLTDKVAAAIDEIRGVTCLPVNRTIAAMRAARLRAVRSPQDAEVLARLLGVEGIVIGTVSAYDPYEPPTIGLSLALFVRTPAGHSQIDPAKLQQAFSDDRVQVQPAFASRPVAVASEHLDAANHDTLAQLRQYAQGRHDLNAAKGWKSLMSAMDRYSEFAAFTLVSRLVDQERLRAGAMTLQSSEQASTGARNAQDPSGVVQADQKPD